MGISFLIKRGTAGSPLATESDPNALGIAPTLGGDFVDPRVFIARIQPAQGSNPAASNVGWFLIGAKGGTTCSVQLWWYEATTRSWWPFGAAVTATPLTPVISDGPRVDSAPMFLQVVTNTGVEQIGAIYS